MSSESFRDCFFWISWVISCQGTSCLSIFFYLGLPRSPGDTISTPRPGESCPDAWGAQSGLLRPTRKAQTVSLQSPCMGRHCCDPPFIEIASLFEFWLYVGILVSAPHLVLCTKSHFLFLDVGSPWLLSRAVQADLGSQASVPQVSGTDFSSLSHELSYNKMYLFFILS